MTDPRIIGTFHDYDELIALLRQHIATMGVRYETIEEVSGIPKGYLGRLIQPMPIKGLNRFSLGPLLGALGLAGQLVVDEKMLARIKHRLTPNNWPRARNTCEAIRAAKKPRKRAPNPFRGNSEWGRIMALRKASLANPRYLSRQLREAVKERWRQRDDVERIAKHRRRDRKSINHKQKGMISMKPHWDNCDIRVGGMTIKEVVTKYDNIFIEDVLGNIWQVWIEFDGPKMRLIERLNRQDRKRDSVQDKPGEALLPPVKPPSEE